MKKEKPKCCETINNSSRHIVSRMINGMDDEICGCNAKYFEDGLWYCGRHAPSKVAEREEKSYQKWKNRKKR